MMPKKDILREEVEILKLAARKRIENIMGKGKVISEVFDIVEEYPSVCNSKILCTFALYKCKQLKINEICGKHKVNYSYLFSQCRILPNFKVSESKPWIPTFQFVIHLCLFTHRGFGRA